MMIRNVVLAAGLAAVSGFGARCTGQISDSGCGLSHAKMLAEHKDLKTDRDCTLGCIKAGGKYVFVSEGKVYNISNQKLAGLEQHAGETVELTGTMKGDTITVTKVSAKK